MPGSYITVRWRLERLRLESQVELQTDMGENISASVEAESPKHDNIPLGYSSCSKEPPHVHVDAVEQRSPKEKIFDDC